MPDVSVGHVGGYGDDAAMSAAAVIAGGAAPSLMQGWVPVSVELVAAVLLGWVLVRRCRPSHIALALALGLATAFAARFALQNSGLSGEAAPWPVWAWTAATAFTVTVAVAGWRERGGWWRHNAVLASSLCLLSAGLVVNGWIGYLPTVAVARDQLTGRPLPHQVGWGAAATMRARGERPRDGRLVAIDTGEGASGFHHRTEWVYLPPAWFRDDGAAESVVVMIGGEFTTAVDWARAGQAVATADRYAAAHDGNAPILVFADANGAFTNDTECVNGIRGRAADHLTREVVPEVAGRFGVSTDPRRWSVAGFSSGGTCAVDLAVMHPELFGRFVDIAGDERPNTGNQAQTVRRLFGGDRKAWAEFDPATVIAAHGRYADTAGLFIVPNASRSDGEAAQRLCGLGTTHGIRCSIMTLAGRHTWPFAAVAFGKALPWLAGPPSPRFVS